MCGTFFLKDSIMSPSREDEFVFSLTEMPRMSFCAFQAMRQNGDLCDVTFYVSGKKIIAHRVILAAHIPYFCEVFLCDPATSKKEITFEMMEPFAFESLIEFAYTSEIKINIDNARSLLIGATLLKMDEVCTACIKFISSRLHPGNALEIQKFASSKNFVELKEAVEEYVLKHFVEISHSESFLDMQFDDLRELIGKDELHVMSEEEVFQAVIAWVKKSPSDRKNKLPQLLTVVRMPQLSYHYLSTSVASEELIKCSATCANLVNEAKGYWTDRSLFPSNLAVGPRNFCVNSYMTNSSDCKESDYFYALCSLKRKEAYPTVVVRYNLGTTEWKMMNARTTYVRGAAVAIMDKKLYVIGGCNKIERPLDAVQVFDIGSDSWSFAESFPSKIDEAAAVVCSGKIYVFGGKSDGEATRYVYCYSLETKWKYVDKMYEARKGACAVTLNDFIYIVGGHNDKKCLTSAEMYDPKKDEWKKISALPMPVLFRCAASNSNRIYAYSNVYVHFYDDRLKEWDRICIAPRQNAGSVSLLAFEGRLYVVGNSGRNENFLHIYDLETDKWISGNALPLKMEFICAVAITTHC